MTKYIDADKLIIELFKGTMVTDDLFGMGKAEGIEFAASKIQSAPAADVVEVVRCGNCKFSDRRQCGIDTVLTCENEEAPWGMSDMAVFVEGNDFCKYGAKMDKEGV